MSTKNSAFFENSPPETRQAAMEELAREIDRVATEIGITPAEVTALRNAIRPGATSDDDATAKLAALMGLPRS